MQDFLNNKIIIDMKNTMTRISMAIIILTTTILLGCGDNGPTAQEKTEALLVSAQWKNPVVTVDGIDQSALYQNFKIQFGHNTYTSSGGEPLWPASGTWVFVDENATTLKLDGKLEIQISELTETNLELIFQNDNTTFTSGRSMSIKGENKFRLKK
jgi:hypothetical protein